ncbi:inactive serine/threonine-protein kinase TEX14-like [Anguilla rostrata]|uniref:inactive serine/threonine-protein kinase TEX14-like n=1 Tax=Anguilla rostrata TaxID=7938 RepID=UPI0030D28C6D
MAAMPLLPCPVRLGIVKDGGPVEQLHKYTLEKNLQKMEKLLKKGVHVDSVNNLGQTPLFCASLLGLTTVVELLLRYGADPNHRCEDRSTPVHAAVFSCKPWLLSGVLDAGGDLRLHDHKGHTPQDWAKAGAQEHSQRMVDFLKRCVSHMHSLSQPLQPQDHRRTPSSSKTLLRSPSLLEFLRTGSSDLPANRKLSTKSPLFDTVQCFGFGKLCVDRPRQPLGLTASLPFVADRELGQADDEPMVTYTCESFIKMTNYSWKGCRVTVKDLQSHNALQHGNQVGYLDLLITEQEYCCQLYHPHLLQLLAVGMSPDVQQIRLVFERVHMGSLHTVLHHRREQYPALQAEGALSLLLQVCEALLYLHGRGLVMRSLSSHAVQVVHPGVAKVTGLGFAVPSCESGGPSSPAPLPLPQELYNWAAPEAIRNGACCGKADLYSLCALIQELFTDAVPWGPVDPRCIRQAVESGQALAADGSIPQPYCQLVRAGLQPRAQERSCSLQDLRYLLRSNIRELAQSGGWRGSGLFWETAGPGGRSPEPTQSGDEEQTGSGPAAVRDEEGDPCAKQSDSMVAREIEAQLNQLDQLLDGQEEEEEEEDPTASDQSSPLTTFCESLSLEDCRPSLDDPQLESSGDSGSESSSTLPGWPEQAGPWGGVPAPEPASREAEHIGSVVLNLKVSQVLLQQSESSLRVVEAALGAGGGGGRGGGRGVDEVDGAGADQPDGGRREGGRGGIAGAQSEHVLARATGPPSRSYLPCRGPRPGPGTPHGAIGDRERGARRSVWEEELSFYSSAQEESFGDAQAERSSVSTGGPERGEQQSACRQGLEDRTYTLSTSAYSPCGSPRLGWSEPSTTAKWTSEVSEAVARMTRGRFGSAPCPTSSDSEETDRRVWAGRQDPLGHSDPRGRVQELQEVDSGHSSAEMEHLFKSFAGIQSESEGDSDFHTVNRTFGLSCGAWEGAGQEEEEGTSDSDYAQSPEGPSSVFYTPNPELQPHPTGRCSQTPSSDGDLEVTMEVCQPTASSGGGGASERSGPPPNAVHPLNAVLQRSSHSPQRGGRSPAAESAVTKPAAGQQAPSAVASGLPDLAELAELSSITCSPAQNQEWAGQPALRPSPLGRRPAPCNSTPRSPVGSPHHRPMDACAAPLPHLPSLLDTCPWSDTPSQTLSTESFATATPGDSSTTETSASSVLRSPMWAQETDTPTGPRDPPAARGAAGASANRDAARPGDAAPAVNGVENSGVMPEDRGKPGEEEETPDGETLGSGPGRDSAAADGGAPGENARERTPSPDDRCVMEETQRAHSTLDADLQGLLLEMATGQRFMESPGAIELPRVQDGVWGEKTSHPGGDSMEAVIAEGKEASSFPRK